jgi:hypothetical protein
MSGPMETFYGADSNAERQGITTSNPGNRVREA